METAPLTRGQWLAVLVGAIGTLALLVHWGGTAQPGPSFVLGVAVFVVLQLCFAGLTYWLLFAPAHELPSSSPRAERGGLRQLAAVGVLTGGFLFAFAASWDEAWHRNYGGFGNDFWWRPHLLLYGSFALISLMAAGLLWVGTTQPGSLRARARSEPFISLLALIGGFLALSAPSDELWHRIYGLDLTAWSLPHTTVVVLYSALMLCGVALALSGAPRRSGSSLWPLSMPELLSLALLSSVALQILQFATTEWEEAQPEHLPGALSLRPEWLYPVVIVALAALLGGFVSAALRRPGAASAVAGLALLARFITVSLFAGFQHGMSMNAYLLFALAMVVIDVHASLRQAKRSSFDWFGASLAVMLALGFVLLSIPALLAYPRVTAQSAPEMLLYGLVAGLGFGWAGWRLGAGFERLPRQPTTGPGAARVTVAALSGAALLVALLVLTAQAPS